jgi:hypothetical protein
MMHPLEQFQLWLGSVERRLRYKAWTRGAAIVACAVLAATVSGAWASNRLAFSDPSLWWARLGVFLAAAFAVAFGIAVPLLRVNRKRAASEAERRDAEFGERARTLAKLEIPNSFHHILAEEALGTASRLDPALVAPSPALLGFAAVALAGLGTLWWLTTAAPGTLGHGAALLWKGVPPGGQAFYRIEVLPGDAKVRKGMDQVVEAKLIGFDAPQVRLLVRPKDAVEWETVVMEPKTGALSSYGFLIAGLSTSLEYRVEAGRVSSATHTLTVLDLPSVKHIRVTYHFPPWLGQKDAVEDPGGDLRAVEGTEAELEIQTSQPLGRGVLVLDDGTRVDLARRADGSVTTRVPIRNDGTYHLAALDGQEIVRISDDYFIEARAEKPPEVRIVRPGRDARVSPIEEVPIEISAEDDYGVNGLELHYSVNGGDEKTVSLLSARGARQAHGTQLIALEDFKLVPGDILSFYGVARDARSTTQTDIYFLEAQPFEREYSQSQQAGGGGGQGGQQGDQATQIPERQKEIIAATWNEIRSKKSPAALREDAEFLAGVQQKLSEQAKSLARRMESRELASTNEEFQDFSKEMEQASKVMTEAVEQLRGARWRDALPPEQRALQHLLRAASMFRRIQVAFGRRGGGGGGGGGSQNRDLESLFDLELDTEKNQYETRDRADSTAERDRQVDEALKRLEELARRQQQLADQQRQQRQQTFQQRWAQEMLRREAEDLRRQMEQLSRGDTGQQNSGQNQPQQQGQQGQQQGGQSSQSGGQAGTQGSQQGSRSLRQMAAGAGAANDPRLNRAIDQIQRSIDDMRRAQQGRSPGQTQESADASAQRAAERMAEARNTLNGMRRQQTGQTLDNLASRAAELAQRQKEMQKKIEDTYGASSSQPRDARARQDEALAGQKDALRRDYEQLERDLQASARSMAGSQRQAATRLRDALGEAQQNEIRLRLQFGAENLRRGMGRYLAPRERVLSEMMDELRQRVEQARDLGAQPGGQQQGREAVERALEQLERARGLLSPRTSGQQGGRQGEQQTAQAAGQQAGRQQGGGQGQGAQQQGARQDWGQGDGRTRSYSAMNDGSRVGPWGGRARDSQDALPDPAQMTRAYEQALAELERLRLSGEIESAESRQELEALLTEMQRLDPKRFPGNPALLEALRRAIVPRLEQVELLLRRQLGAEGSEGVRATGRAQAPPGYEKAVAEYFRKLSSGK